MLHNETALVSVTRRLLKESKRKSVCLVEKFGKQQLNLSSPMERFPGRRGYTKKKIRCKDRKDEDL